MGLEVVFDNHPVRKQTFLDYKNIDLNSGRIEFSRRG